MGSPPLAASLVLAIVSEALGAEAVELGKDPIAGHGVARDVSTNLLDPSPLGREGVEHGLLSRRECGGHGTHS
jgi:hypothetical protein